jgi:hypothetical protein
MYIQQTWLFDFFTLFLYCFAVVKYCEIENIYIFNINKELGGEAYDKKYC